jgi:diguanylate cyclase (GGDEF)-like protein
MEYLKHYFLSNIFLIVISAIMLFICFYNFKQHKKVSILILIITGLALFLSITESFEIYLKEGNAEIPATLVAFFEYILRPAVVVLFIFLSQGEPKGKWLIPFFAPLVINLVIFLMCFIPGAREHVFYFLPTESSGLSFQGGNLRYSSHIVALFYTLYFFAISVWNLKLKHIPNAIIILICIILIVTCVSLETFFDSNGELHLLNTGIMISVMSYYLFLYIERVKHDPLTGLFNRAAYYEDILKMQTSTTAVIQFDMNGLKYLNDNFGHEEGDKAIQTIANIIASRCNKNMYAYRLGGDEFIIIVNRANEETVQYTVNKIQEDIHETKYNCAIGLAYRNDKNTSLDDLIKQAEDDMYADKTKFYQTSKIERRK